MKTIRTFAAVFFLLLAQGGCLTMQAQSPTDRVRARELGIRPGVLPVGEKNDITDVPGVRVGHFTLIEGGDIRTGATAILPHEGNLYQNPVAAAVTVGNGYGKMAGISQISELGEIETPIVLTNTLSVDRGMDAIINWTLRQSGNERVRSVNAVVGETNDGGLNNIRKRILTSEMIEQAIESASPGPVEEGAVGAGTGTIAFGWKGGIGSSSRILPETLGGFRVGVLVQSNFGGILQVDGMPVGETLGQYYLKDEVASDKADGSIMIVVATDAPLSSRNLERLSRRAIAGLARTGASMTNGSGDYVIAFSTSRQTGPDAEMLGNADMSPLFQAVIEATEEAIYNSLFMARTVDGFDVSTQSPRRIEALPLDMFSAAAEPR
jgi:D-aminopeptidase